MHGPAKIDSNPIWKGLKKRLFGESLAERFLSRPSVGLDILHEQSGSSVSLQAWQSVWIAAAHNLGVEPGKLRPQDRLCEELSSRDGCLGVHAELENLSDWLEFELNSGTSGFHAEEFVTLNDVIERVVQARNVVESDSIALDAPLGSPTMTLELVKEILSE
ncbi:MAG: hypothetical protein ACKO2G_09885 [Verrucomicrobiales bacterium]